MTLESKYKQFSSQYYCRVVIFNLGSIIRSTTGPVVIGGDSHSRGFNTHIYNKKIIWFKIFTILQHLKLVSGEFC